MHAGEDPGIGGGEGRHLGPEVVPGEQVAVDDDHDVGVTKGAQRLPQATAGPERSGLDDTREVHPLRPAALDERLEVLVPVAGGQHDPTHAGALERTQLVLDQGPRADGQERLGAVVGEWSHPAADPAGEDHRCRGGQRSSSPRAIACTCGASQRQKIGPDSLVKWIESS